MSVFCNIYSLAFRSLLKEVDDIGKDPFSFQKQVFENLMKHGAHSSFGAQHHFQSLNSYHGFQQRIPLHQYEDLQPYIDRLRHGEEYVLWNQKTRWYAKSSGTSGSKSKYIPITPDSLWQCHYRSMRGLLAVYLRNNPQSKLFNGKSLTLGGSCRIDEDGLGKSRYGDLSAVLLSNSPWIAECFRTPSREIVLQEHFEHKLNQMSKIIARQNITNFSGVPSWNLVLFKKVLEVAGKEHLAQVWPNLELFMHGGISFDPYQDQYKQLIPKHDMHYMETYNASEGFFAFQDDPLDKGMLLLPNAGIFYEFIPLKRLPEALSGAYTQFETLEQVAKDKDYALVISTNGGLWRYLIGDTIRFTSLLPHRIIISGRTKLFINAFGEELMIDHAEKALAECCLTHQATVSDFTVAPLFMDSNAKGAHEWLVEFERPPANLELFTADLDRALCAQNSDYEAKRANNATMLPLQMHALEKGCFYQWFSREGKLGGQNKMPRLSGSRHYVEALLLLNESLKYSEIAQ